jgi:hypothetical protein
MARQGCALTKNFIPCLVPISRSEPPAVQHGMCERVPLSGQGRVVFYLLSRVRLLFALFAELRLKENVSCISGHVMDIWLPSLHVDRC